MTQVLAGSPTMVGAVTTLIVIVAVFLSYNANTGLPFVPVYRVALEVPNSARLTPGNEVRIGGHRVGVVESIEAVAADQPATAATSATAPRRGAVARIGLKLDRSVAPLPRDSVFRIRYQSTFGLKYLEVVRGTGAPAAEGFVFDGSDDPGVCKLPLRPQTFSSEIAATATNGCFQPQAEFDDLASTFDRRARADLRVVLSGLGDGLAGRGASVGEAIRATSPLMRDLRPVLRAIAAPESRLERLIRSAARVAAIVAPVADRAARLATNAAVAFEAISRDPEALAETITGAVPLLERGVALLPGQRRLLADVAELARRLGPGVAELPPTLPVLNDALAVGRPALDRVPAASVDLRALLVELRAAIDQPQTKLTLRRLRATFDEALPLAAHVAPAQTVCNYPTYLFTYLAEHLSLRSTIGYTQRNTVVQPYAPDPGPVSIGGVTFDFPGEARSTITGYSGLVADGLAGQANPAEDGLFKPRDLPIGHGPVNAPSGQLSDEYPDCAAGQFGYPLGQLRLPGQPIEVPGIGVGDLEGSAGPTTLFLRRDGTRELRDTRERSRAPTSWGLERWRLAE